jgi:putative tricarboxylic transport membrane protein
MGRTDQVSGLFWVLLGGVICFESTRLGLGSWKEPGPGFMCLVTGSLAALLGAALFIKSLRGKARRDADSRSVIKANVTRVGIVISSLVAYIILLSRLGYILSTFLLLGLLFNVHPAKGWPLRLIAAAAISLITFIAFRAWLDCPLPRGIFSMGF